MRSLPLLAVLVLLASCVAPTPPPAPQPPRPVPVRAPALRPPVPLASDWRDWPLTPGDWVYRQDARGSIALFGPVGGDALLTLRCDLGAGTLYLSRAGTVPGTLTIRTSTLLRSLPVAATGGMPPYVAASIAPRDALLEAMGFSRGRFVIEQPGYANLVVPAWAEILRVTEDCRR